MPAASNCEVFTGANFLRMRLVLSTVTGKSVKIKKIRPKDQNPGLNEYEANFLRLLEKMTNGSRIEASRSNRRKKQKLECYTSPYQPSR